jgi:uncharacterized damage-inducible protein DinB
MQQEMSARFRKWFEYEKDAHAKVLQSLETVPASRRDSAEYRKAVAILAHLATARRIWLGRLGVIPLTSGSMFPEDPQLADVSYALDQIHDLWTTYLAGMTDLELPAHSNTRAWTRGVFET